MLFPSFNKKAFVSFLPLFSTLLLHQQVAEATPLLNLIREATCLDAPRCGFLHLGTTINVINNGVCQERCTLLPLLSHAECGECCVPPATVSTRLFDQNIFPDTTSGTGIANGAFTTVTTGGLELGLRGKTRYPNSKNPANEADGEGSQGDGTYKFPAGTFTNGRQFWAFDWHVNTDLASSGASLPSDFTYEFGVDSDASAATIFDQYDEITGGIKRDHSFDTNAGTGDSGDTCVATFAEYQACLDTMNVVQNTGQYAFLSVLPGIAANFNPANDGNYVIYVRALKMDPICGVKYIVAEVYIEVLVGDTAVALTSPPILPDPL